MAMFLVGDHWNNLCETLKLPRFSLSLREKERATKAKARAAKMSKSECLESHLIFPPLFISLLQLAL